MTDKIGIEAEFAEFNARVFLDKLVFPWDLRDILSPFWLRLYHLPGGEYPTMDETQLKVIKANFNEVAAYVFEDNPSHLWILAARAAYGQPSKFEKFLLRDLQFRRIATKTLDEDGYDVIYDILATVGERRFASYEKLVEGVALDRFPQTAFLSQSGDALTIYDGGMDLIIRAEERRHEIMERFKELLSRRDDGL